MYPQIPCDLQSTLGNHGFDVIMGLRVKAKEAVHMRIHLFFSPT